MLCFYDDENGEGIKYYLNKYGSNLDRTIFILFKWSNFSEDVGKQKFYIFLISCTVSGLVWSGLVWSVWCSEPLQMDRIQTEIDSTQ